MAMPAKRSQTDDTHISAHASNAPQTDLLSEDLFARLRGVGSRVRKSVNEGYKDFYTPPIVPGHANALALPSQGRTFFRSASDTLRDVYNGPPRMPAVSATAPVKKRSRSVSDDERDEHREETAGDADKAVPSELDGARVTEPLQVTNTNARPMRPLGRTRRPLGESQSLPARTFGFSKSVAVSQGTMAPPEVVAEEEDWSMDNFAPPSEGAAFSPVMF